MPFKALPSISIDSAVNAQQLTSSVVRGTFVTGAAQIIKFCCQFGTMIALTRLLSPADFGLFGVVFALIVLFEPIKEGGLALSTLQKNEVTHKQISNLF
ncbi:MAG: oligosaccharide flippase family protein, partial [Pyrinomonadaceae bacterium]